MKKGSIRGVLAAAYLCVMSASLFGGLFIYQSVTFSDRQAKAYIQKLQDTKDFEYMLDLAVGKTIDNSLSIVLDKNLESILANGIRFSDERLSNMVDTWLINNSEVSSVHIVNLRGEVLSKSKISTSDIASGDFMVQFSQDTLQQIDDNEGEPYFGIGSNLLKGFIQKDLFFARRINSSKDMKRIGYLFVFFDRQALLDKMENYVSDKKLKIILTDDNGNYMNFCDGAVLGEMYHAYRRGAMTEEKEREWKAAYHHVELKDDRLGVQLITDTDRSSTDTNILNIVSAILLVNFVFLTIGTLVVRRFVISPLEEISSKTRRITEEADLSIRFDETDSYTEAGSIVKALNEMLEKINGLIKENREKEKQKRMLELSVVNHQVNPHFLFNTLNSVNVLIAMEDKKTALKLVASLARYYRACLNQEETINTIEQEITVTKEYITIMQLKNPGMIHADFEADEKLYGCKVPGMILQTLVENCIKYGIRTMEEPLLIKVTIREEKDKHRLAMIVRDNGKGMSEEICHKLMQNEKLKGKSGFGLRGTIKRIRLMYNIKEISDILKVDSKLNEYTEISIFIPI